MIELKISPNKAIKTEKLKLQKKTRRIYSMFYFFFSKIKTRIRNTKRWAKI